MVPVGNQSAASLPSSAAPCSCSALTDGSSPNWSSPTGAAAITARISGVGRVTVSERRSIKDGGRRKEDGGRTEERGEKKAEGRRRRQKLGGSVRDVPESSGLRPY